MGGTWPMALWSRTGVEPVDPAAGWPAPGRRRNGTGRRRGRIGLVKPDDGLGQRVVVAVPERCRSTLLCSCRPAGRCSGSTCTDRTRAIVATLPCWSERRCSSRASAGVFQLSVLRGLGVERGGDGFDLVAALDPGLRCRCCSRSSMSHSGSGATACLEPRFGRWSHRVRSNAAVPPSRGCVVSAWLVGAERPSQQVLVVEERWNGWRNVQGHGQRRHPGLRAGLDAVRAAEGAGRRAERRVHRARRRRLLGDELLRRADRDAEHRCDRRRRRALPAVAHHGAVLADPVVPADGAQPHPQQHGVHHRGGDRVPERQRHDPAGERHDLGDPR